MHPRVSPDGRRIAVVTNDPKEAYISIYDLAGGTAIRRLTFGGNNRFPIWSRDSQRVTFQSDRDGDQAIFWQLADGTGEAERLTKPDKGTAHVPYSWSPKDETLLFAAVKRLRAIFAVDVLACKPEGGALRRRPDFDRHRRRLLSRWTLGGVLEWRSAAGSTVYVQPFPATGAKYQLAAKSGDVPHHQLWSPDGRELFYNPRPNGFEVVPVTTQPTFAFGNPTAVPSTVCHGSPDSSQALRHHAGRQVPRPRRAWTGRVRDIQHDRRFRSSSTGSRS